MRNSKKKNNKLNNKRRMMLRNLQKLLKFNLSEIWKQNKKKFIIRLKNNFMYYMMKYKHLGVKNKKFKNV